MIQLIDRYLPKDTVAVYSKRSNHEYRKCETIAKNITKLASLLARGIPLSLHYFMRNSQPLDFSPPMHTYKIASKFDRVIQFPNTDPLSLCLSLPPQHGKTELIKHFIALYILTNPTLNVAYVSFSATRSKDITGEIKTLLESYGMEFKKGSVTKDIMTMEEGGKLITTSFRGGLTGQRVDLLIVDDPVKGQLEARSITTLNDIKKWFSLVANSRKTQNTSVVVISTRWSKNDLIGHIQEKYKDYEIINIPALCIDPETDYLGRKLDETLAPLVKSQEFMEGVRATESGSDWNTMYQGVPTPDEDRLFSDDGILYYKKLPDRMKIFNGLDLAYTIKKSSDYTVFVTLAKDVDTGDVYIINMDRFREEPSDAVNRIARLAKKYPHPIIVEKTGTQVAANEFVNSALQQHDCPWKKTIQIQIQGDKYSRALKFAHLWNSNKVYLPDPETFPQAAKWIPHFRTEVLEFTGADGAHDDVVDATDIVINHVFRDTPVAMYVGL